jgi:CRISPR-associated endonuclease/helicase Cas3
MPPKATPGMLLRHNKAIQATKALRGDQFAVLQTVSLYSAENGLVWENTDYLSAELTLI